jgi:hypothetical protein
MSGKTGLLLVLIVSGAVLVYTVTTRLSDQTLDVLVGLSCGIGAMIPVSAGLLIALTRRRREKPEQEGLEGDYLQQGGLHSSYNPRQPYPPVIVVTPQQSPFPHPFGGMLPPGYNMNEPPMTRNFKIVGEDDDSYDA